jgi:hypothetical protein
MNRRRFILGMLMVLPITGVWGGGTGCPIP